MKLLRSLLLTVAVAAGALAVAGAPAQAASVNPYGCDYSYSRPSVWTLDHPGVGGGVYCRFVARYLYTNGKGLSAGEARTLHANGRDVVLNWEGTGHEVVFGYAEGAADARKAAALRASVGAPASVPVIFSVDFDLRDDSLVVSWLRGAESVLGRGNVGVYGSKRVVEAACAAGIRGLNWQTYAWSAGQWASPSCAPLRQIRNGIVGGSLDLDVQAGAYPFWGPNGPTVRPTPAPGWAAPPPAFRAPARPAPARRVVHRAPVRHRSSAVYVTLRRGDTVGAVARRSGTSVSRVAALNGLRNPNRVYAGQRLRVR